MAKTKAELEFDFHRHATLVAKARKKKRAYDYPSALSTSLEALKHVDGMLQYAKRYQGQAEHKTVESIALILHCAPLLFRKDCLEEVGSLMLDARRVEKMTSDSLKDELAAAFIRMWEAYHLWDYLEREVVIPLKHLRKNSSPHSSSWNSTFIEWENMGLLRRVRADNSPAVTFSTRMTDKAKAMCPNCGAAGSGQKLKLLSEIHCPSCKQVVSFVFLSDNE